MLITEISGKQYSTCRCSSTDFKVRSKSKIALDDHYRLASKKESIYDFCIRQGFGISIHQMLAVDYIILN